MSNFVLSLEYSQICASLSRGQKCSCRSSWSTYCLQLFVTIPTAETLLWWVWALPDCFIAKSASGWSSGFGIVWVWFWGGSLSAGEPLGSIKNIRHPIVFEHMWTNVLLAFFCICDWYGLTFSPNPPDIIKKIRPNWDWSMLTVKGSIEACSVAWVKMKLDQRFVLYLFFLSTSLPFVSIRSIRLWDGAAICASTTWGCTSNLIQE